MFPLQAKKLRPTNSPGFTLIELLVVIAIISLLSSIVLASLGTARDKAKDAAIMETMTGIRTSAEIYFGDNGNSYNPEFTEADCPNSAADSSMFDGTVGAAKNIFDAIQYAKNQSGGVGRCASNNGYAVAIPMKIQDGGSYTEYFCIDAKGTAKIGSWSAPARAIVISSDGSICNPTSPQ